MSKNAVIALSISVLSGTAGFGVLTGDPAEIAQFISLLFLILTVFAIVITGSKRP